jgi:hypothetical protein
LGQPSIVKKLHHELAQDITTERQVVYILAEIRKLLELRQEKKKYFALNFYTAGRFTPKWTRLEQNEFSKDSTGLMRRLSARANRISKTYPSLFAGNSETMVCAKFREQLEA